MSSPNASPLRAAMSLMEPAVDNFSKMLATTLATLKRSELVTKLLHSFKSLPEKQQSAVLVLGLATTCSGILLLGRRRRTTTCQDNAVVPAFHKLLAQQRGGGVSGNHQPGASSTVHQIVLTGGPVGGKATLAGKLRKALGQRGWDVVIAPSVVALLGNAGINLPAPHDGPRMLEFESAVLELQHHLESSFKRAAAATGDKSVVIYDRGILDPAAFVPREQWPALAAATPRLDTRPLTWYTAVVHLVSAADGAQKAFDAAVRREAPHAGAKELAAARAEALRIDSAVHDLQQSHPGYVRIDNSSGNFERKLQRAVDAVVATLDAPPPS